MGSGGRDHVRGRGIDGSQSTGAVTIGDPTEILASFAPVENITRNDIWVGLRRTGAGKI